MKRIIAIILLMCILALSGCNTEKPDTNEASDNNETIKFETTTYPRSTAPLKKRADKKTVARQSKKQY